MESIARNIRVENLLLYSLYVASYYTKQKLVASVLHKFFSSLPNSKINRLKEPSHEIRFGPNWFG
jgi:hypothetical protein